MNKIAFTPRSLYFQQKINSNSQPRYSKLSENTQNKTIIAAALASACLGIASADTYNKYQAKALMQDMMEEYKQDDTKSLKIEDLNNDKSPEIIIEKDDGVQCVYDIKNQTINYKVDDEYIEKIR